MGHPLVSFFPFALLYRRIEEPIYTRGEQIFEEHKKNVFASLTLSAQKLDSRGRPSIETSFLVTTRHFP
jgi:hypothetical protein